MSPREAGTESALQRALRRGGPRTAPAGAASRRVLRAEAAAAAARLAERAAAEGVADVAYAQLDSPFGALTVATTRRGVLRLAFPEEPLDGVLGGLAARVSPRIVEAPRSLEGVRRELEEYFAGSRRSFRTPLDWTLIGPFGRRVLGETAAIAYGSVLTYRDLAGRAGSPRASRAAGNALARNPIPIVIPCHRVLRTGGALGGYAGGIERKRWLLEHEQASAGGG